MIFLPMQYLNSENGCKIIEDNLGIDKQFKICCIITCQGPQLKMKKYNCNMFKSNKVLSKKRVREYASPCKYP